MAWVVDTCVLIDVAIGDPAHGLRSARCLESHRRMGLLVCPVTFVEVAPVFAGNLAAQQAFLAEADIGWREPWSSRDTEAAHALWAEAVLRKRRERGTRRPAADVLIAAFASRFEGLITRDVRGFSSLVPRLPIVDPSTWRA